jgi:long-subunit fatty acid transport protein
MRSLPALALALAATAAGAIIGLGDGPAAASPRSDPTTGRAVFTGATMRHASSISLNPAALGLGVVTELYVAATATLDQRSITPSTIDPDTGALTAGAAIRDVGLAPGGAVGLISHVFDRATLGFEIAAPPGERFPQDHLALAYHTLGGGQRDYRISVGFSAKVADPFYVGISVSLNHSTLGLRYARDTALDGGRGPTGIGASCGAAACGVGNPAAAETYDIAVGSASWFSTQDLTVNLGIVIQLARDTWLGVAYHTPPGLAVQSGLVGTATVTRAPRDGGTVVSGDAVVDLSLPASVDAELRARITDDLDLHVGGRWEDLSRLAAYDVRTYGTALAAAHIPEWMLRARGLHDPIALWAGVEQPELEVPEFGQRLRLGARLGLETSSVASDHLTPETIAGTSLTVDGGASLRLGPTTVVQLSYGLAYFPGQDVGASAFDPRQQLDCVASGYDYATPACAAVRGGYGVPTAAGHYGRLQHALRLGFRYEFR